jgi:hypothetical protein
MRSRGISSQVRAAHSIAGDVSLVVALERSIAAASVSVPENVSITSWIDLQHQLTLEVFAARAVQGSGPVPAISSVEYLSRIESILGMSQSSFAIDLASVTNVIVALTPTIRSALVFRDIGGSAVPEGEVELGEIPYVILALHFLTCVAVAAGQRRVTYQTVVRLFADNRPLLVFLAKLTGPVAWREGSEVELTLDESAVRPHWELTQRLYIRFVKEILSGSSSSAAALVTALRPSLSDESTWIQFCRLLATHTWGRVVTSHSSIRSSGPARGGLRRRFRKWMIRHLHEDLVLLACRRSLHTRQRSTDRGSA